MTEDDRSWQEYIAGVEESRRYIIEWVNCLEPREIDALFDRVVEYQRGVASIL